MSQGCVASVDAMGTFHPPPHQPHPGAWGVGWQWVPCDQGKQAPLVPFSPHWERSAGWCHPLGGQCEEFLPQVPVARQQQQQQNSCQLGELALGPQRQGTHLQPEEKIQTWVYFTMESSRDTISSSEGRLVPLPCSLSLPTHWQKMFLSKFFLRINISMTVSGLNPNLGER